MVAVKVAIPFSTDICILSSGTLSRILIVYLARNDRPPSIWQHVISRLTRMSSISAVSKIEGFTEGNTWKIFSRMFYSYVQAKYMLDSSLSQSYIYQSSSYTHQLEKREILVVNFIQLMVDLDYIFSQNFEIFRRIPSFEFQRIFKTYLQISTIKI